MSRRKKRASSRRKHASAAEAERPTPADRALPEPNPPRPNKAFLITTVVLLMGWVAFLIVLALVS
jgi:hypothetical protein